MLYLLYLLLSCGAKKYTSTNVLELTEMVQLDDEDCVEYSFDSAWSPPHNFIEKVSKDFPLLRFRLKYEEPGMCYMGVATSVNGNLDDQCIQYD